MSEPYIPGEFSKRYHSLKPAEREVIRKEVDKRFRKKTSVDRQLDPKSRADLELRRTWLRIRDEVMEQKDMDEWMEFRHELDLDGLTEIPFEMRSSHWDQGADLLETWFGRPPAIMPNYSAPVTDIIKMDWVLGFGRARSVYDQMIKDRIWTNTAAQTRIKKLFTSIAMDGKIRPFGDLSQPTPMVDKQWVNSRPVSSPITPDGLTAALGGFELHVAIAGQIAGMALPGGQQLVLSVEEIGIYVWDSFDFEGEQFLGIWGYRDTPVNNSDFREWRQKNHAGGDFLVYSDIKRTTLKPPDAVTIKL